MANMAVAVQELISKGGMKGNEAAIKEGLYQVTQVRIRPHTFVVMDRCKGV
jgi:hypothetical protein